ILVREPDNPAERAVVAISGRLVLALDVRQAVRGPEPEKLIGLAHAVLYDRCVILPSGRGLATTAGLTHIRLIVLRSGRGLPPPAIIRKVQRLALRRRCDHLERAVSCGCLA